MSANVVVVAVRRILLAFRLLLLPPPALRVLVFDRATMIATMDEATRDTLAVEI
jgi:hypothetical protein